MSPGLRHGFVAAQFSTATASPHGLFVEPLSGFPRLTDRTSEIAVP